MVHAIIVPNEQIENNNTRASVNVVDKSGHVIIEAPDVLSHGVTDVTRHVQLGQL